MKKVGLIGLVLVLALAVVGIGYAHWSKDLFINGEVNTDTLCAEWWEVGAWDTEDLDKDFSEIKCKVNEEDPLTLDVTVINGYPCIDYYNEVEIHNCGTIPLHVIGIDIVNPNVDCVTVEVLDANLEPPVYPVQVHPCEVMTVIIHVHLEQCAEQGATYTFTGTAFTVQWNYTP